MSYIERLRDYIYLYSVSNIQNLVFYISSVKSLKASPQEIPAKQ